MPAVAVPGRRRAWQLAGCHYADVHQLARRLAAAAAAAGAVRRGRGGDRAGRPGPAQVTVTSGHRRAAGRPTTWCWRRARGWPRPAWRDLVAPLGLRVKKIVAAAHRAAARRPSDQAMLFDDDDAFLLPLAHQRALAVQLRLPGMGRRPGRADRRAVRGRGRAPRATCCAATRRSLAAACDAGRVFCDAYSPDRRAAGPSAGRRGPASSSPAPPTAPATGSPRPSPPRSPDLLQPRLGDAATEGVPSDHQYV